MIWRDVLLGQLDSHWQDILWPRLAGLSDDECFWEPLPAAGPSTANPTAR